MGGDGRGQGCVGVCVCGGGGGGGGGAIRLANLCKAESVSSFSTFYFILVG